MSTIHCNTPDPRRVGRFNLFDTIEGITSHHTEKPRDAEKSELVAYLDWLAMRSGVHVPHAAQYGPQGIFCQASKEIIVAMPGYGQSQTVTCELLGDDGEVVKTMPLPVDRRGKLPMNAKDVHGWTGLAPVKKARKPAVRKAKAAPVEAVPVSADVAALLAAVEKLAARVSELETALASREAVDVAPVAGDPVDARDAYIASLLAEREDLRTRTQAAEGERDAAVARADAVQARYALSRPITARRLLSARAGRRTAQRERIGIESGLAQAQAELARLKPIADMVAAMAAPAPTTTGENVVAIRAA